MISTEIMLVIAFTLLSSVIYTLYIHFEKQTDNLEKAIHDLIKAHNQASEQLRQRLKDGLQSNAICCRSAIDKINTHLREYDKDLKSLHTRFMHFDKPNHGSINVVIPSLKEEKKSNPKKEQK